ncbi:MAG: tetraacyldisaccharide 4'-kinase [Acidobacteria bacterium]|nr:tetraacyldisaccharide 4'-kinase [Acidobacteriota bacterium]
MRPAILLLPLTPLYGAFVRARALAYRRGVLRTARLGVPVVSVGNLTFGGTGKTPVVIALARDLVRRGRRPAVLTRGYGRDDRRPLVLVGPAPAADARRAGDEPLEIARRLPGVPVVVDADRVRGGREAIRRGADIVILDDGFQHLRLARDLDIVLVDAGDPWGGGHLPPLGRLREPTSALARAGAVIVTKLDTNGPAFERISATLRHHARGVPVFAARLAPVRWTTPAGERPPREIAGRRVFAFAGIGRPEGFVETLERLGAVIAGTRWFTDHHVYTSEDAGRILDEAGRLDAVPVTTAKDAVKAPSRIGAWVLDVEMTPADDGWDPLWALAPEILS